jgi:prepilin signal peptidase PulO-like enzyme (type II secretory pathway)
MILSVVISAVVFGCAAFLSMQLSDWLGTSSKHKRLEGEPTRLAALQASLTVCTALIGGVLASREVSLLPFITLGLICVCLCAAWYSDTVFGYIPDYFTLGPLAVSIFVSIVQRDFNFSLIWQSAVCFLPFGIAAAVSKGRGMGWGDSKLAALGGYVLGFQMALLTFAAACLALVAVGWIRGKRNQPLAFAPYLAVAIVLGVLVRVVVSAT